MLSPSNNPKINLSFCASTKIVQNLKRNAMPLGGDLKFQSCAELTLWQGRKN